MNGNKLSTAVKEANRFLDAVEKYHERVRTDRNFAEYNTICGFRESGAVRRASMDLTRALSDLRKP